MTAFYSNIYINNLNPFPVSLSVSFPGNVIETGEWALSQTSLAPFDPNAHLVGWVSRDVGIKDGVPYTMLINVSDTQNNLIVSANIGLTGTFASSDIQIGAQNSFFTDTGHSDDGPFTDTWTDAQGNPWAIEFNYGSLNSSGYYDVVYSFYQRAPGQSS